MHNQFYRTAILNYIGQIMKRNVSNPNLIERISTSLTTENDVRDFCKFISEVYESGFLNATEQYRENLSKLGYTVEINQKRV